jgi:hypothetical protein
MAAYKEIIQYEGRDIPVYEIARPEGWQCRILRSEDGTEEFLSYMAWFSPWFEMSVIHKLTEEQIAGYRAGTLRIADLAEKLLDEFQRQRSR